MPREAKKSLPDAKKTKARTPAAPAPPAPKKPVKKRSRAKGKSKGHAPTVKETQIIKRRDKILDLRENGASIRQISAHLKAQGEKGASVARVHELLVDALEDLFKSQRMKARHIVVLETNKLDRVELAHFNRLLKETDPDKIEKLTRAMERVWKRRDGLLGLNKPAKIELTGEDGGPIETKMTHDLSKLSDAELVALKSIKSKLGGDSDAV